MDRRYPDCDATPRTMNLSNQIRETLLFWTVIVLGALAWLLPTIPLAPHYHDFADQRTLFGIPCALDVLSNAPFSIWGIWGLLALRLTPIIQGAQRQMATLFFWGLIATALGSAYYHLAPNNAGLVIDRYGMTVAFAGLMGLAATTRASDRAGSLLGWAALALGSVSVYIWGITENMTPWVVFQGGGILLILGLLVLRPNEQALQISWRSVLAIYIAAKLFELYDAAVFNWTGCISGHSLKHIVASLAAWPVLVAIRSARAKTPNSSGS
jgi:hypothetical protein